jgi:hypothetical protein
MAIHITTFRSNPGCFLIKLANMAIHIHCAKFAPLDLKSQDTMLENRKAGGRKIKFLGKNLCSKYCCPGEN